MPNSFDEYLDDKKLREVDLAGRERSLEEMREIERELALDRERQERRDLDRSSGSGRRGAAIPPPSIYHKEDLMDVSPPGPAVSSAATPPALPRPSGASLAEKMMKNMGWKGEGHGLGRNEQGMAAPLKVKKVSVGTGRVIAERMSLAFH